MHTYRRDSERERALIAPLAQAPTPRRVGRCLDEALIRLLQTSGINCIPMLEQTEALTDASRHIYYRNDPVGEFDYSVFLEMAPHCEREYFKIDHVSNLGTVDMARVVGKRYLQDSFTYNEFYQPLQIEHQVISPLPSEAVPRGFLCVTRPPGEPAFSDEEIACVDRMARAAGQALESHAVLGPRAAQGEVDVLVRALSHLPLVAGLFAPDGRVRWLSNEALLWLEAGGLRLNGRMHLLSRPPRLEMLAGVAHRAWNHPAAALDSALPGWRPHLGPGERLVARRISPQGGDPGGVLVCVADGPTPATPEAALGAERLGRLGLTPREAEVTALVAQGYSLEGTAANLGLKPSTVHTHLKRVYTKLDVFNRAELTYKLLTQDV